MSKTKHDVRQVGPGDDPEDWQLVSVPRKKDKRAADEPPKKDENPPKD